MLAPNPIEALFGHAKGDDDIYVIAVVLLGGVFQRRRNLVPFGSFVIDQIGNPQNASVRCLDQLEARRGVRTLPVAQLIDDVLDFPMLVLRAFARIDARDMDDGLLVRVENLEDVVRIRTRVEEIADVELLQIFVAVELLIIGVGNRIELGLVVRHQNGFGIASEIRSGHRDDMNLVPCDQLGELRAKLVLGVRGNVVELIHGDEAIIERLDAELLDSVSEGRMGTDEHLILALEERPNRVRLATVRSWRVAKVPLWLDMPVGPETELG